LSDTANGAILPAIAPPKESAWRRWSKAFWRAAEPVIYGLIAGGVLLLFLGKNPLAFYWATLQSGLLTWTGLQQTIIRLAPLLLMSAGFIVAFQAGLWNIGGDGQFLMAAAMVGGLGASMVNAMPYWLALILLCIIGFAVGGAWTIVPSFLKAYYGMNEIITSLMMAYLGINLANLLIKGPFLTHTAFIPETNVIPFKYLLPYVPGTSIHIGIIIALVALGLVHYMQTRTGYGLRLRILGANPKAAVHAGINVKRDIITAFALSGALIGLAAAVEVLGVWGYVRADWNPGLRHDTFRHRLPGRPQRHGGHPLRVLLRSDPDRRPRGRPAGWASERLPAAARRSHPVLHGAHRVGTRPRLVRQGAQEGGDGCADRPGRGGEQ
jgi:general nucleoside transport system permease protein